MSGAAGTVWLEGGRRQDGVAHALSGGLWLHRHTWYGRPMAHLVSSDRDALVRVGLSMGLHPDRLQYRPLKHPEGGVRLPAWHWDLVGPWLPPARRY